jgi:hypothetical protein
VGEFSVAHAHAKHEQINEKQSLDVSLFVERELCVRVNDLKIIRLFPRPKLI